MRISDWSSDVCSSDLIVRQGAMVGFVLEGTVAIELHFLKQVSGGAGLGFMSVVLVGRHRKSPSSDSHASRGLRGDAQRQAERDRTAPLGARPERSGGWRAGDRKSVVSGKSVSVRVDLGGRRIIKKTK